MTHPLTDEICNELSVYPLEEFADEYYDKNYFYAHPDGNMTDMRAAADWQLEQVIRYLENDLEFVLWSDSFMDKFKKAMRPQQQEDK